jgi:hypothetical protein
MKWEVSIVGDARDLRQLSHSFQGDGTEVAETPTGWVLRAKELDGLPDYSKVRQRATEILRAISGAARLLLGSETALRAGALIEHRDDGTTNTVLSVDSAVVRVRGSLVSLIVTRADGTVEQHHPAEPAPAWVRLAAVDELVARALRLRDQGALEWVDLYRLFEVMESDTSVSEMVHQGWTTERAVDLFKRTANSQRAIGDKARHGKDRHAPPATPMSLGAARSLIDGVLKHWLRSKAQRTS